MFVIRGRRALRNLLILAVLFGAGYWIWSANFPANGQTPVTAAGSTQVKEIELVTGEYAIEKNGEEVLESYRWDPGTIVVNKGDQVQLRIHGVRGESHPFLIEGLGIRGEVKQGQETVVEFKAKEKGTYRLICLSHSDKASDGPMIGYIVVQ